MHKGILEAIQHRHFADGRSYDRHADRVFGAFYRRVAADVAARVPEGGVVLDAGCGTGNLASRIAHLRPDVRVRGVDLSPGMIEVGRERAEREGVADRVEFTVADLAELPLEADSVDLVVSTASMHHWTDVPGVVAELRRVLRAEGTMWIYDLRWMSSAALRSAASAQGTDVTRSLVRTGRLPFAAYQRLAVGAARL